MRAVDIIYKKRSRQAINQGEIDFIIQGYLNGAIPEYQVSALLMAIFFNGMNHEEIANLTKTMIASGKKMDLKNIGGPFVDKHSTGGVGDKISLILAPMVASCGVKVPMMSGRALGYTGGTLDKLDSIPGYKSQLSEAEFKDFISLDGFAMTGQTNDIVPADKRLYALRDVTATIESIPLITASILSKKVAEGADALVFDVKAGSGAFMKSFEEARLLAKSLTLTGKELGKKIVSVITSMDEPLGNKIGNFFEIEETIDCLEGSGPSDIMELTYSLGSWMLILGNKARNKEEALEKCKKAINTSKAYEYFIANIKRQGGDYKKMLELRNNYRSQFYYSIEATMDGYIKNIDSLKMGQAGVILGIGRNTTNDRVYPDVGFILEHKAGTKVKKNQKLCTVFAKDKESLEATRDLVKSCFSFSEDKPEIPKSLILEEIES